MAEENVTRKLAAILYADVAGYSRLTGVDEVGTHRQLSVSLDLMADRIRNSGGRVVHYAGDAVLASFESVVAATNCAIGIQCAISARCAELAEDRRLLYRIGINLGEVIVDRDDIYGDGVNVSARLESLAEPGGICVSASVHEQVKDKIDARFEDMGNQTLKNIERPVQAYRVVTSAGAADAGNTSSDAMVRLSAFRKLVAPATQEEKEEEVNKFSTPELPSIMILPFKNLSGDDDLEALVDGFRLSIQSTLVKLSGMFLINAPVAETYRHREVSAMQAGNEVGIRYVLDGAVQMAGDRIRVTVQLTDAPAAQVIWADRYDRIVDDIFEIQDEITTEVAVALDAELGIGEQGLIWWDNLPNWKAREHVLRGLSHLYKFNKHDNALARRMFKELDQIVPGEPQGLALMALTHWFDAFEGWSEKAAQSVERATELAREAVALGDPDGFGHIVLGHVRLFQRQHDEALSLSEKSVAQRLSCPLAIGIFADVLHYCGKPDQAIKQIKKAVRHSRIFPPWMVNVLARSYRDTGKIIPSVSVTHESLRLDPENLDGHVVLCTDYGLSNSLEEARRVGQEILRIDPSFSTPRYVETQPYKESATLEVIVKALREAGLPD
jgi:class 3 adenylate cyclase/TolB-like protein